MSNWTILMWITIVGVVVVGGAPLYTERWIPQVKPAHRPMKIRIEQHLLVIITS